MSLIAKERNIADRRQLGGILLVFGISVTTIPLIDVSTFLGKSDGKATWEQALALAAGISQILFGSLAIIIGYLSVVHDYGSKLLSGSLLVLLQTAWLEIASRIIELLNQFVGPYTIKNLESFSGDTLIPQEYVENEFIPPEYLPSEKDVLTFGIFGLLGEISYLLAFFGALGFIASAIYAFDSNKPATRDAKHYRSLLLIFSFVVVVAGLSQVLLGGYILFVFGTGPLAPSMRVAMYIVYYPEISIAIGAFQMFVGYYGIARYLGFVPVGPRNHQLQILVLIQWISMLTMQYMTQAILSLEDGDFAENLPSWVLLSIGLNIYPAFLDYKMRTAPYLIPEDYYGIANSDEVLKRLLPTRKTTFKGRGESPESNIKSMRSKKSESDSKAEQSDIIGLSDSFLDRYEDELTKEGDIEVVEEIEYPVSATRLNGIFTQPSSKEKGNDEISIHDEFGDTSSTSDFNRPYFPPGINRDQFKDYPKVDQDSMDTPDDSTEALEEKLLEIEREIYTDSMESFRKSLTEIL